MKIAMYIPVNIDTNTINDDIYSVGLALTHGGHEVLFITDANTFSTASIGNNFIRKSFPRSSIWTQDFWAGITSDAVLFVGWGSREFIELRPLILKATPNLFEILDHDGVYSPHIWFSQYISRSYWLGGNTTYRNWLRIAASALIKKLLPKNFGNKEAIALTQARYLIAETALVAARTIEYCNSTIQRAPKVYISTPTVNPRQKDKQTVDKENIIVCVGRWHDPIKDINLHIKSLTACLRKHKRWRAVMIGGLPDNFKHQHEGANITFTGKIPIDQVYDYYNKSKIFFIASRSEAYNTSSAEAIICGCSTVGHIGMTGLSNNVALGAGSVSINRTKHHLCQTLSSEIFLWDNGIRNADTIRKIGQDTFSIESKSKKLNAIFKSAGLL